MKFVSFCLMIIFGTTVFADLKDGNCSDAQKSSVLTTISKSINGTAVDFDVTTGYLQVATGDRKATACIFYIAYVRRGTDVPRRPITFAFNGGPGSASVWLHLGFLGPKRADMGEDGLHPPAVTSLVDNEFSLLDTTDIIMIDPVATGFSFAQPIKSADGKEAPLPTGDRFFGVKNDYTSVGTFIQNYLNLNFRWRSPKFILGESYGGIRGPLLTNYLQSQMNMKIDGLILISPALSNSTFFSMSDNSIPYWTFFPSFATTAWYHKVAALDLLDLSLPELFKKAKFFAENDLKNALDQGSDISAEDRERVAQEISNFLGLRKDVILKHDLHIDDSLIFRDLLEVFDKFTGRYDGRFTEQVIDRAKWDDPSGTVPGYVYAADINDYLRSELKFITPAPYMIFGDVGSWYAASDDDRWDVMPVLSQAMANNPNLRVFIASGYFDLACPAEGVTYELRRMAKGRELRGRIQHRLYEGGHMVYLNPSALRILKADVQSFMTTPTPAQP